MKKTSLVLLFGVLAWSAVGAQNSNPMREGRWEVTMQMQMPGMQMPAMKSAQCVTKAQVQDPANAGLPSASPDGKNTGCKVSDYKIEGSKVTWKMACTNGMNGSGDITYMGDAYEGAMKVTTPQGEMTMKMNGKRLGDCTP